MKKESFEFLKTVASLENCIKCVQNDVKEMLLSLPEESGLDRQGISYRADHLKYWLNQVIYKYDG